MVHKPFRPWTPFLAGWYLKTDFRFALNSLAMGYTNPDKDEACTVCVQVNWQTVFDCLTTLVPIVILTKRSSALHQPSVKSIRWTVLENKRRTYILYRNKKGHQSKAREFSVFLLHPMQCIGSILCSAGLEIATFNLHQCHCKYMLWCAIQLHRQTVTFT